ncbi:ATP-binding protein [Terrimonas sp. NA20]|uniref:histidine kinase n=1 Tax=Terrimonas ginsenosidimutans TaxID=2908004 RepID=A0ABS9KMY3_9BACT|nr:ATP-binding protein [Terrimonas ginsenosidimutans]MCG2613683.1 ATP-binding protein [Terrimonas ginsenosidimutans]
MLTGFSAWSQTKLIDSLKQYIYAARNDKERLKAILDMCEEHRSLDRDTLDHYAGVAVRLAEKVGDKRSRDLAAFAMANTYNRWGASDSALILLEPVLSRNPVADPATRELHYKMARQKALYLGGKSRFPEALSVLYQLVANADRYRDTIIVGANKNTIGSVWLQRGAPRVALEWLQEALAYSTNDSRYKQVLAGVYANMGDAYSQLNKYDSAEYFIEKGVLLFRELQNLSSLAITLQKQSTIYLHAKKFDKAEEKLKEMIDVRKQTNDEGMWIDENLALVDFYIETKQIDKAIAFCQDALRRAGPNEKATGRVYTNSVNLRLGYYEMLAKCYKIAGKNDLYQRMLEDIIAAKDSFYQTNSAEALAEVQTKYEVQKRENTIVQQQLNIARSNIRFYLTLAGLLFVAAIGYLIFTGYRRREKLKVQLMLEREKEMGTKAVAEAEEKERKRIAADLHDNLGAYAASIASNLDFIPKDNKSGQEAVALQELHSNSKAIVSQLDDTIWALNKDALTLTAISDRLKIFARRMKPSYPNMDIDIEENIAEDISLPPTQAFHLFQVIQEAVVNAMKHSGGTNVKVMLETANHWRVSITDNGTGMKDDRPAKGTGGNGLTNMRNRASAAGWKLYWEPATPGMRVIIEPDEEAGTTN